MTDILQTAIELRRVVVPDHPDAPDAGAFRDMVRLMNATARRDTGHADLDCTPEELLPRWQDTADARWIGLGAWRDGVLLGVAALDLPQEKDDPTVEVELSVDPDRWGEGVEDALLNAVEHTARENGRHIVQMYSLHRPGTAGPRLHPPTGFGSVPADDRITRLSLAHGYALEQVERNSALDLDTPTLRLLAEAQVAAAAAAGAEYRLVSWTTTTPDEFKDSFAYIRSRMSTDVPSGELVWIEEVWDAARVERRDERLRAGGITVSVQCALHEPTGVIAAYTELMHAGDEPGTAHQWGTLVLKEHRGHRLGMLVKAANLRRWSEVMPHATRVSTFNAEENRHMLDINEAVGFRAISVAGAWKKVLA